MKKSKDLPWDEAVFNCQQLIGKGLTVFQKFTCSGCGQRLTMPEPDTFFQEGTCDKCPAKTDIRKTGFGYMVTTMPPDVARGILGKLDAAN